MVEFLSNPVVQLVIALMLSGIGVSGRPSMTVARALLLSAWALGTWALCQSSNEYALVSAVLWSAGMGWLVSWAQPILIPGNVGRLVARRTIWSLKRPMRAMEIDGTSAVLLFDGPEGEPLIKLAGSLLTIERYGRHILVSTDLRDKHGHLVARLDRNEWKVSAKAWDRNYNNDSLEVLNAAGDVVLQVRVLSDRIQLQGEWWAQDGTGIRIEADPSGQNGQFVLLGYVGSLLTPKTNIKPLFRYPSEFHLGELVN